MVAATAAHTSTSDAVQRHVVEHDDHHAEHDLEQEQLDRDRGRLAEEDRPAVEAGEPQAVAGPVGFLDRERATDREQRREQDRGPEQAGRGARQQRAVGVEREREQHDDDPAERQDLLQRDARPALDPQVFAGDEQRLAQEASRRRTSARRRGVVATCPGRPSLHLARSRARRARSSSCDASSTVQPSPGAARTTSSRNGAALLVEPGVRFVEQQQPRRRARARSRATAAGAGLATAGRASTSATRWSPTRSSAASASADRAPGGAGREAHVLGHGEVVVTERLVADERRARAAPLAGRGRDRRRAPRPCPTRSGSKPAHSRSNVVLPAPFGAAASSTISPASTSRSAPASAGNRPACRRPTEGERQRNAAPGTGAVPTKSTNGRVSERGRTAPGTLDRVRRTIAGIGRTLVTLGLLILLFVAYQLWGTGIFTARAQEQLKNDFAKQLQAQQHADDPVVQSPTTVGSTVAAPPSTTTTIGRRTHCRRRRRSPPRARSRGSSRSPRSGSTCASSRASSRDDLKKGPGHYPLRRSRARSATPRSPATARRTCIPFYRVDELGRATRSSSTTLSGLFTYSVTEQLDRRSRPTVRARSAERPEGRRAHAHRVQPAATRPRSASSSRRSWCRTRARSRASRRRFPPAACKGKRAQPITRRRAVGQTRSTVTPTIFFGIFWALVGLAWWWAFRRWRHPVTWFTGVMPFLVVLFPFYVLPRTRAPARTLTRGARSRSRHRGRGPHRSRSSFARRCCAAMRSTSGSARRCS